jgi:hypothetical protein
MLRDHSKITAMTSKTRIFRDQSIDLFSQFSDRVPIMVQGRYSIKFSAISQLSFEIKQSIREAPKKSISRERHENFLFLAARQEKFIKLKLDLQNLPIQNNKISNVRITIRFTDVSGSDNNCLVYF